MNENENTLNNSDHDFLVWDMNRPYVAPAPGDWAYGLSAEADPFAEPGTAHILPF